MTHDNNRKYQRGNVANMQKVWIGAMGEKYSYNVDAPAVASGVEWGRVVGLGQVDVRSR